MIQGLRIGNLFMPKEEYKSQFIGYREVTTIYKDKAVVEYHYPLGWFDPIPLTAEILEKAGFEKDAHPSSNIWVDKNNSVIIFWVDPEKGELVKGFYTTYWKSAVEIKYLHQLQNIYYCLCGEELNINL